MADFIDPDSIDSAPAFGTPSIGVRTGIDAGAIASTLTLGTPRVALDSAFHGGGSATLTTANTKTAVTVTAEITTATVG